MILINDQIEKQVSPYQYDEKSDNGAGTCYAYDSRGNRIRTTNALGEIVEELSYNLNNQPTVSKDAFGTAVKVSYEPGGQIKEVRRLFDANWNKSAAGESLEAVQQFEYNARGQITGIVDANKNSVSYDLDGWV